MQRSNVQEPVTYIGYTNWRNQNKHFGIKASDRLQGIWAIGKTGTGKSTLIYNMAVQDILSGHATAILDPHGDLAESLSKTIPDERLGDLVYFNAAERINPVGFNPLQHSAQEQNHLLASEIVSIFKKIWIDSWGVRLEYILRYCILTLLQSKGSTLLDIQPLLIDKNYRDELLSHISDQTIINFWQFEYDRYSPSLRYEAISSVLNKSGVFIADETIKAIIGQQNGMSITDIIESGKILIVNLSKGLIGEQASTLLGSMITTGIQMAVMRRARISMQERQPLYLYIDEAHSFITPAFAQMLSECRKYKLGLFLAHQYIDQLTDNMRDAIVGNIGTIISFRLGAKDANYMSQEFYPVFKKDDFINLPQFHIYLKLLIGGVSSKGFSAIISLET